MGPRVSQRARPARARVLIQYFKERQITLKETKTGPESSKMTILEGQEDPQKQGPAPVALATFLEHPFHGIPWYMLP